MKMIIINNRKGAIMPNFDGRGPAGFGPMTGGGRGFCAITAGSDRPFGYGGRMFYGGGRGGGNGRGMRNWFHATGLTGWQRAQYGYPGMGRAYAPPSPGISAQEEARLLKEQAGELEQMLADINRRINELAGEGSPREEKNEKKK